jgi:hypothetical protein
MPFLERDPWRMQYFTHVACPDHVAIPTDDADAWDLFPRHRWVYNKLMVAESQGLEAAPHGVEPPGFPVFSKPVFNMKGMGVGSRTIADASDYERHHTPGHMWMRLLVGEHVSSDVAVANGEPAWWRHVVGAPLPGGAFDHWTVLAEHRPAIEDYCGSWIRRNLAGYSGIVNFETIDGRIIECHLRMSDQWPDLYGPGWAESVVELYERGRWRFHEGSRRTGYSVVLFGAHGRRHRMLKPADYADLLGGADISSIQITFHGDKPPEAHAMPPGGFRLAIVNGWDLAAGQRARLTLEERFERAG